MALAASTPTHAAICARLTARPCARPVAVTRRSLAVRASAEADSKPALIAVAAPIAAVAASSMLIGSGVVSSAGIEAYLHTTAGFVFDANAAGQVPEFVTHYFHGLNMATVLFAMGGYGTYLGWKVRAGGGAEPTFGTADSAAELHPKLMAGMTLFFLAGGQGGLLFNLLQGKPLLDSPHAVSALAGLMLLGANGVLGGLMGDSPNLRTTHALLGSSLMLVFVVHAGLGIQLALSL